MALFKTLLALPFVISVCASPVIEQRQSTLPTGWTSIGCYSDSTATRTLQTSAFTDVTGMSIESCIEFCTPAGFRYAGVEFSRECYCDNVIESPGAPTSGNTCNMPCAGDSSEICGGPGGLSVFQNTALPPPPPTPPVASIKPTAGTFQYKGCFQDGVNGAPRSLANRVTVAAGVSAESCTAGCKAAGYPLAGLEFGQECWCDVFMPLATSSPDSECNMACQADNTELCGAGNRLAVYQDTTATPPAIGQCLNGAQLHSGNSPGFATFHLFAAPTAGGAPTQLGTQELAAQAGQPTNFLLASDLPNEGDTYRLFSNTLFPDQWRGEGSPIPLAPSPGGIQTFWAWSTATAYAGYCAMPNPFSSFGPFIGPPILSVSGFAHRWGLCNGGAIFTPGPNNVNCTPVVLLMVQPATARF